MVKRIRLSRESIESVQRDIFESGCKDTTGDILKAPVFVLIPLDDNQVVVGADPRFEETGFREKPLLPKSLISAAFFVGEGSEVISFTIDGVSFSLQG